jgi:hypothetical protein
MSYRSLLFFYHSTSNSRLLNWIMLLPLWNVTFWDAWLMHNHIMTIDMDIFNIWCVEFLKFIYIITPWTWICLYNSYMFITSLVSIIMHTSYSTLYSPILSIPAWMLSYFIFHPVCSVTVHPCTLTSCQHMINEFHESTCIITSSRSTCINSLCDIKMYIHVMNINMYHHIKEFEMFITTHIPCMMVSMTQHYV